MAKNENRPNIALACTECKHENYVTVKNKKNTKQKSVHNSERVFVFIKPLTISHLNSIIINRI